MIAKDEFFLELIKRTKAVFSAHPEFYNHFGDHPWLQGALGNPNSKIVFIAENPSLKQVEDAKNPDGRDSTPEAQWWASAGDKIFRQALFELGLKTNPINNLGGWNCYITNVIKEADYVEHWRKEEKKDKLKRKATAISWFEVLRWELATIHPERIIVLGKKTKELLDHITSNCKFEFPKARVVYHYSYIGLRPDKVRRLCAGHPIRILEYVESIRQAINN